MTKNILKILVIFILGALGGVWAQASLLPYLAEKPSFQNFQFVKDFKEKEVIVHPRTEITVQENVALSGAIEKAEKVVIGVKTETPEGKILEGSGLAITSDGLIVTLADLIPRGSAFYFYVDKKWPAYQVLKRENNLALVKVGDGDVVSLSTTGFADPEKLKLGERVFLIGLEFKEVKNATGTSSLLTPSKIVNEGIISAINEDSIQTNIFEESNLAGSPLFNIEGNVVGLTIIDGTGRVSAIPVTKIRQFIGF